MSFHTYNPASILRVFSESEQRDDIEILKFYIARLRVLSDAGLRRELRINYAVLRTRIPILREYFLNLAISKEGSEDYELYFEVYNSLVEFSTKFDIEA